MTAGRIIIYNKLRTWTFPPHKSFICVILCETTDHFQYVNYVCARAEKSILDIFEQR